MLCCERQAQISDHCGEIGNDLAITPGTQLPSGITLTVSNGISYVRITDGKKVTQRLFKTSVGAERFIAAIETARNLRKRKDASE
jgi:hypothetical protein